MTGTSWGLVVRVAAPVLAEEVYVVLTVNTTSRALSAELAPSVTAHPAILAVEVNCRKQGGQH